MVFAVRSLCATTWPAFAALVERHHGVWGGCWCLEFHPEGKQRGTHRRSAKEERVRQGTAHASLVFDGPRCIGWCQFGPPDELPRIKHLRVYTQGLEKLPDWRITCFFVDKEYRGQGVASAALAGASETKRGAQSVTRFNRFSPLSTDYNFSIGIRVVQWLDFELQASKLWFVSTAQISGN